MKNKNVAPPPAPIICKLNNFDEKLRAHAVLFAMVSLMILKEDETCVTDYFEYLNYFSTEDYRRFNTRITDKRNKEVPVNQLHFILFYSILHLSIQLYQSKRIMAELVVLIKEKDPVEFEESNKSLIAFCNNALDELRRDYKNNNALIIAMAKIDGWKISH